MLFLVNIHLYLSIRGLFFPLHIQMQNKQLNLLQVHVNYTLKPSSHMLLTGSSLHAAAPSDNRITQAAAGDKSGPT